MSDRKHLRIERAFFTALLAGGIWMAGAQTQPPAPNTPTPASKATRYHRDRNQRAELYYSVLWGVDSLSVRSTESGEIVRFAWRVVDPEKAKALHDKAATPQLIDPKDHVALVVPSMEKVGQLRNSGKPEAGKSYWMAFSNKGRYVKPGDRVNVVIGQFRVEGLIVE